jgi:hypothetical protein
MCIHLTIYFVWKINVHTFDYIFCMENQSRRTFAFVCVCAYVCMYVCTFSMYVCCARERVCVCVCTRAKQVQQCPLAYVCMYVCMYARKTSSNLPYMYVNIPPYVYVCVEIPLCIGMFKYL